MPLWIAGATGGTTTTTTAAGSIAIPGSGVGVAAGQVAVLTVFGSFSGTLTTPTTPTTGWTKRQGDDHNSVNNIMGAILSKTLAAGDVGGTISLAFSAATKQCLFLDIYDDASEADSVFSAFTQATSGGLAYPNPTLSAPNNALVQGMWCGFINSATSPTCTKPSSYTDGAAGEHHTSNSASNIGAATAYKKIITTGTYGGDNCSFNNTTARQFAYSAAIAPKNKTSWWDGSVEQPCSLSWWDGTTEQYVDVGQLV
jgi:hypothetical protein